MGVVEIICFAACWLAVASLMLWGVFTENRRGEAFPPRRPRRDRADRPPSRRSQRMRRWGRLPLARRMKVSRSDWHPSRLGKQAADEWVVADQSDGGTPDVAESARFLAGAWLASRGIDIDALHPDDIRLEVTTNGDGVSTTRILVRSRALQGSRRRH